jgi:pantothenate kinase
MTMSSVDTLMIKTYEELSRRVLVDILKKTDPNEQYWICLAGGPGAGKSTLSTAVVNRLNELTGLSEFAVVLPMDGFHFSRKQLKKISENAESPTFDELLARRGSPWTFDAKAVCETLIEARKSKEGKRVFGTRHRIRNV